MVDSAIYEAVLAVTESLVSEYQRTGYVRHLIASRQWGHLYSPKQKEFLMLDIKGWPKFKASDGREIVLLSGWFENRVKQGWPYGIGDFETFVNTCILSEKAYPTSVEFCLNKLITADAMKSLIEESGYEFRGSERLLDLCTGPAVLPRVFKALGLCEEAYGVDVEDRSRAYSDDKLMSIWRGNRDSTYQEAHKYGLNIFEWYERVNSVQTGINNSFYMLFSSTDTNKDCSMDGYDVSDLLSYAPNKGV